MANTTEQIYLKVGIDSSQFDKGMAGMKKEMMALKGVIGNNLISKEDQQVAMNRLGDIKGAMQDLNVATNSMDTGDVFQNMAQMGSLVANSVGGITAAMGVLGIESKLTEGIERKLMMSIQIAMTLQELADSKRLKGMIMIRVAQLQELLTFKVVENAKKTDLVLTELQGDAAVVAAGKTSLWTRAQLAWNAAMAANPIGMILLAIAALTVAVGALYLAFRNNTEVVNEWEKALDGTVIKNEDARKAHNETLLALEELGIEYKLLIGTLTEYGAEQERITNQTKRNIDAINLEYKKAAKEITDNSIWKTILGALGFDKYLIGRQIEELVDLNVEKNRKLKDEEDKSTAQRKVSTEKQNRDLKQKLNDFNVGRLKDTISTLNSEYNAYVDSNKKILDLYTSLIDKRKEFNEKFINLSPEDKEIQDLEKYKTNFDKSQEDIMRQLKEEEENYKAIGESIKRNEALLNKYKGAEDQIGLINKESLESKKLSLKYEQELLASLQTEEELYGTKNGPEQSASAQKILDLNLEIRQLEIDGLQYSKDKLDVEKSISENMELQRKSLDKTKQLEAQIKKVQYSAPGVVTGFEKAPPVTTYVTDEEKIEKAKKEIREKYARERLIGVKNNEKAINDISIKSFNDIISNQKTNEEDRKKAIVDRNIILVQQNELEQELLDLKIKQLNYELAIKKITKEEYDSLIKLIGAQTDAARDANTAGMAGPASTLLDDSQKYLQSFADFSTMLMDAQLDAINKMVNNQMDSISKVYDNAVSSLEDSLEYGIISQENFNMRKDQLDKERAARESALLKDQWDKEKKFNIARSILNGAQAILNGFATPPFPAMGILATLLAATQIALIANQPTPTFATGGYINGLPHSSGGVNINAEGGEYMIQKSVVQRPGMGDFLNKVNSGQAGPGTNSGFDASIVESIVKSTIAGITSIPVINVESESTRVQRKVNNIESSAKW